MIEIMSGWGRYFLLFASAYACLVVYVFLDKQAMQSSGVVTMQGTAIAPALRTPVVSPLRTSDASKIIDTDGADSHTPANVIAATNTPANDKVEEKFVDPVTDLVSDVVLCKTTYGDLIFDVRKAWAPIGAARFVELVDAGHFTNLPFYRVCPKYLTQFGKRYYDPEMYNPEGLSVLKDDSMLRGIRDMDYGYLFFATAEENNRRYEMAISFCEMENCDVTGLGHKAW